MLFSSNVFLFLFLPLVIGLYYLTPVWYRNGSLLLASLLFYAWGGAWWLPLLLVSIIGNYLLGLWISRTREDGSAHNVLALAVILNVGSLVYFKYLDFLIPIVRFFYPSLRGGPPMELPIGISFYTFHALSYLIDLYRGRFPVQKNPVSLALYITLFPQLIAGPIVRYSEIAYQLGNRTVTIESFAQGIYRLIMGLAKKILIANSVASVADSVFGLPPNSLGCHVAWLGVLCYSLQIYFDFSGYSDMAIGLALMFGFTFPENFNYPYFADSVTDFWRRWHISLSTWFRDYLYIPLGGNRAGPLRTYANLLIVFTLCGLWHGASWNFLVWGLFHGSFLILERCGFSRILDRSPALIAHVYTCLVVMAGWVFFRASDFTQAMSIFRTLVGLNVITGDPQPVEMYLDSGTLIAIGAGCFGAMPWLPKIAGWISIFRDRLADRPFAMQWLDLVVAGVRVSSLMTLLVLEAMTLSAATYNPFIYFRF